MKKRIKRTTRILGVAAATLALTGFLALPARYGRFSTVARAAAGGPGTTLPALQGDKAVQELKQQGLYDSLQEAFAAARYELRWEERSQAVGLPPAFHAPNPAHRLNGYFTSDGLHLAPDKMRSEALDQAQWRATMKLIGYGYGDNLMPAGLAELQARSNRIEFRRAALPITEWYVNKPEGLEQGFTIDVPPGIRAPGDRLRVTLEVTGDVSLELTEGGQAVALKQGDGTLALTYRGLHAYDAQGRALPSQMRVSDRDVILELDDEQAVYPVTIDPTFTQQAKLLAGDRAADDYFGIVAIYSDTAVVGAPRDDVGSKQDRGSVYVFVRSNGSWSQQARLDPPNGGATDDYFGSSVAISGDTIVVGVPSDALGAAAYVFVRNGTTWSQQQRLIVSGPNRFGESVAISGDTVVVGDPYDQIGSHQLQGSAYVFVRNGTTWSQQAQLTATNGPAWDFFGLSVAISGSYDSGNTVVVGAPHADVGPDADHGSAYVFVRTGMTWSQRVKLTASDMAVGDLFGSSVAISGTASRVVVGAPGADIVDPNGVTKANQGAAYVFVRNCFGWFCQQQEAKLTPGNGAAGDRFGQSVAINGYNVMVGAPGADIVANGFTKADQGAAYESICNGTCGALAKLTAGDGAASDAFGASIAIDPVRATIVVGARGADTWGGWQNQFFFANTGAAYVFIR